MITIARYEFAFTSSVMMWKVGKLSLVSMISTFSEHLFTEHLQTTAFEISLQ